MSGAIGTRLLKAQCGSCAYTVRVTRRWLAELGPPLCPCNREPLECAQFDDIEERAQRECEAWAATTYRQEARTLRDRWNRARIVHTCISCKNEIPIGEEYHLRQLAIGGEIVTEKKCLGCQLRQTKQSRVHA